MSNSELESVVRKAITIEKMRAYTGGNNIHTNDEAAKESGLGGALVQGGQLLGYMIEYMVRCHGSRFLNGGEIAVNFIKPVRAGDTVEVASAPSEEVGALDIWLQNQNGEKVVVGHTKMRGRS